MSRGLANFIWWVVFCTIPIDLVIFFVGLRLHDRHLCHIGLGTIIYKAIALFVAKQLQERSR